MTAFITITSILFLFIACSASALLGCFSKRIREMARFITVADTTRHLWLVVLLLAICIFGNIWGIGTLITL